MTNELKRPVRASDKVSDVLARDERLVEVFARQSPHFAKLRKPGMRRVMARLVTIEQAARICGAETSALVRELNQTLGFDAAPGDVLSDVPGASHDTRDPQDPMKRQNRDSKPANLPITIGTSSSRQPDVRIIELDVRDDLRQGREPFSRIMAAVGALRDGEVLCLRATFEPVPLFAVMEKRGFSHYAERLETDDWRVWFFRPDAAAGATSDAADADADDESSSVAREEPASSARPASTEAGGADADIVLDVRGLEPPEPMQRTLEALEQLPAGAVLVQVNVRVPHFLLPILTERGFDYEIFEPSPERVVVRIWRASQAASTRRPSGG